MGLVKVFLLDFDLGDFVERLARQVVVIVRSNDLLEVEDRVAEIIHFLEGFGLVEVGLA